jgi:hypothetical protein
MESQRSKRGNRTCSTTTYFRFADGVPRCCQAQLRNNAKSKHKQCRRSSLAPLPSLLLTPLGPPAT